MMKLMKIALVVARIPGGTRMKLAAHSGPLVAKITNAYSVPSRPRSNGKNTAGNTSTEAMPYTKKSKNSEARPMITPMAISPGAILE